MRHLRKDYDSVQPFPNKRPHIVRINGEVVDAGPDSPDHLRTLGKHMDPIIPEDEPVFLLRATDPAGAAAVRCWAEIVFTQGGDLDLLERVGWWADEMDAYRQEHAPDKRVADVPSEMLR